MPSVAAKTEAKHGKGFVQLRVPYRIWHYVETIKKGRGGFLVELPRQIKEVLSPEERRKLASLFTYLVETYESELKRRLYHTGSETISEIESSVRAWLARLESWVNHQLALYDKKTRQYFEDLFQKLSAELRQRLGKEGEVIAAAIAADLANKLKTAAQLYGSKAVNILKKELEEYATELLREIAKSGKENIFKIYEEISAELNKKLSQTLTRIRSETEETLSEIEREVEEKLRTLKKRAYRYYEKLYNALASQLEKELGEHGAKVAKLVAAQLAEEISKVAQKYGQSAARQIERQLVEYATQVAKQLVAQGKKSVVSAYQTLISKLNAKLQETLTHIWEETSSALTQIEQRVHSKMQELRKEALKYYESLYSQLASRLREELGRTGVSLAQAIASELAKEISHVAQQYGENAAKVIEQRLVNYATHLMESLIVQGKKNISEAYEEIATALNKRLQEELQRVREAYEELYNQLSQTLVKQLGEQGREIAQQIAKELAAQIAQLGKQGAQKVIRAISQTAEQLINYYKTKGVKVVSTAAVNTLSKVAKRIVAQYLLQLQEYAPYVVESTIRNLIEREEQLNELKKQLELYQKIANIYKNMTKHTISSGAQLLAPLKHMGLKASFHTGRKGVLYKYVVTIQLPNGKIVKIVGYGRDWFEARKNAAAKIAEFFEEKAKTIESQLKQIAVTSLPQTVAAYGNSMLSIPLVATATTTGSATQVEHNLSPTKVSVVSTRTEGGKAIVALFERYGTTAPFHHTQHASDFVFNVLKEAFLEGELTINDLETLHNALASKNIDAIIHIMGKVLNPIGAYWTIGAGGHYNQWVLFTYRRGRKYVFLLPQDIVSGVKRFLNYLYQYGIYV